MNDSALRALDVWARDLSNPFVGNKRLSDLGPDPVWGVGTFLLGLLIMAFGGAATKHWLFNVGEGLLLLGVVVFVACVAVTKHRHEHLVLRLKRAFRNKASIGD